MSKSLSLAVGVFAITLTAASAADLRLPVKALPLVPEQSDFSKLYVGGQLFTNGGKVKTTETNAATGAVTNVFDDSIDPIGVGFVVGYNFRPWNNNVVIGPFVSVDRLDETVNHNFAGGQFLGSTTHWYTTIGAKAGYIITPGLLVYGLAGVSWVDQTLNINFATTASTDVTTPGFTLGFGGEYQPSAWRVFGNPLSLFAQYQHTWYDTETFSQPASSPRFNYAFKREEDTVKVGANIYLSH